MAIASFHQSTMRLKFWQQKQWRFFQRRNIDRILLIIGILIFFSSISLSLLEPELSFFDGIWWSVVTLTTVGYGDITPITIGGRLIAIFDMIIGVGILAILSATIASILVDRKIKDDLGMGYCKFENHIIICEWNYRARIILKELRLEPQTDELPIVLIADIDRKPVEDDNLFFIKGQVSDETLNRAGLLQAKTVIILGNDNLDYTVRDAKAVLSTLTVESINPHAYTIVELVNPIYAQSCQRAKADEIIVSSELSSLLISQAALNHGVTRVISEILSFNEGNQFHKIPVPKFKVGHSFMETFVYMKQTYQSIVVGVQKGSEGKVLSNPPTDYQFEEGDYLILIATEKPQI